MRISHLLMTAILPLTLAACGGEHAHDSNAHSDHSEVMTDGIMIDNVYVVKPLPGRTTAMAVGNVMSHGAKDDLLSVYSPISERVEIHTHEMEDGVMKMRKVEGALPMSDEGTITLKRGGDHVMIFNAQLAEDQTEVPLTFAFASGEEITVNAPLVDFEDLPETTEDHSGH